MYHGTNFIATGAPSPPTRSISTHPQLYREPPNPLLCHLLLPSRWTLGGPMPQSTIPEPSTALDGASRLRVLGIVLAGGKGTRLYPLTRERAKPAVPFGGKYRIIDFVLSNFVNSGIYSIYVLTQFRSQSLLQHLSEGWQFGGLLKSH